MRLAEQSKADHWHSHTVLSQFRGREEIPKYALQIVEHFEAGAVRCSEPWSEPKKSGVSHGSAGYKPDPAVAGFDLDWNQKRDNAFRIERRVAEG